MEGEGWRVEGGGWRVEGGGLRVEGRGWGINQWRRASSGDANSPSHRSHAQRSNRMSAFPGIPAFLLSEPPPPPTARPSGPPPPGPERVVSPGPERAVSVGGGGGLPPYCRSSNVEWCAVSWSGGGELSSLEWLEFLSLEWLEFSSLERFGWWRASAVRLTLSTNWSGGGGQLEWFI